MWLLLYSSVNILKTIKLYTWNGWIVWYRNYVSIRLPPKTYPKECGHYNVSHFPDLPERNTANPLASLGSLCWSRIAGLHCKHHILRQAEYGSAWIKCFLQVPFHPHDIRISKCGQQLVTANDYWSNQTEIPCFQCWFLFFLNGMARLLKPGIYTNMSFHTVHILSQWDAKLSTVSSVPISLTVLTRTISKVLTYVVMFLRRLKQVNSDNSPCILPTRPKACSS